MCDPSGGGRGGGPGGGGGSGDGSGGAGYGPNPLFIWIREGARRIEGIGAGNPRLEAEYLMAKAMDLPRIHLWLTDLPPSPEQIAEYETLLARRLSREPLQYILGTSEFAGLRLEVGPGVFIPRSETEVLVERVETRLHAMHGGCAAAPKIVDVGTGSGAILLSLLDRLPGASGIGIDAQPAALAWAQRNAEQLGFADRVRLICGDLLAPLEAGIAVDAIVTNPPYVRLDEEESLSPEIRDHEPRAALFGGSDGLDIVRRLVPQSAERLASGGLFALEIGITQEDGMRALLEGRDWKDVEVRPDLTGRPRVVLATRR